MNRLSTVILIAFLYGCGTKSEVSPNTTSTPSSTTSAASNTADSNIPLILNKKWDLQESSYEINNKIYQVYKKGSKTNLYNIDTHALLFTTRETGPTYKKDSRVKGETYKYPVNNYANNSIYETNWTYDNVTKVFNVDGNAGALTEISDSKLDYWVIETLYSGRFEPAEKALGLANLEDVKVKVYYKFTPK
jgi:hypothetical protein